MINLASVNKYFQSYFQDFRVKDQISDPIWKRAHHVSVHCLNTGVCILECSGPDEMKYRQIPPEMRHRLWIAVAKEDQEEIFQNVQEMVRMIVENPKSFQPKFFVGYLISPLEVTSAAFEPYRSGYTEESDGLPNNPYRLMDIVPSLEYGCAGLFHVDSLELTRQYAAKFNDFIKAEQEKYTEVLKEMERIIPSIIVFKDNQVEMVGEFHEELLNRVKNVIKDDYNFFMPWVERGINNLSEPVARQIYKKIVDCLIESAS
jgi:hypothetical protein